MGNLDDITGDTCASTASKKVVWLTFALSVILGLRRGFIDVTEAFMAKKPTRDIYVL